MSSALARSCGALGRWRFRTYLSSHQRPLSTKLPNGFIPPTTDDLLELRERVQDFTRTDSCESRCLILLTVVPGREIPEDLAVKTDRDNEFPNYMWKKLGAAG